MKLWYHPKMNKFFITWHVYGCVKDIIPFDISKTGLHQMAVESFQYVGEAIENEHGVTVIGNGDVLGQLVFLGEL